jgi:hypothetical protein
MGDVGWGTVNQAVMEQARLLTIHCRAKPSYLIKEAASLSPAPDPARVAELLNRAGVDFVLIGAHAIAVFTKEPRATKDVDVVVDDVDQAVLALRGIRPRTRVLDLGVGIGKRIADGRGRELVDVLSAAGGVRAALFSHRTRVVIAGQKASIPTLPAMLALKWVAMFSPSRRKLKQAQDKLDFLNVLEVHPKADMAAVARLVMKANPLLAKQLLHDLQQYRTTGDITLFGAPA